MKYTILTLLLLVTVTGCTKINYVGDEYPPTAHVDIYYSPDDVGRDYKVMGHVVATGDELVSAGKMKKKLIKAARQKGADGVIILGLDSYIAGHSTTYKETTETKETLSGSKTTTTATTSSDADETKEIRATLIKYR
jgi:hypothetical protein